MSETTSTNFTGGHAFTWETEAKGAPKRVHVARPAEELDLHDHSTGIGKAVSHAGLGGVTADQHHAQSHAIDGGDHTGTLSHGALSGVTADQHHSQAHAINGADHSGGTAVLTTTDQTIAGTKTFSSPPHLENNSVADGSNNLWTGGGGCSYNEGQRGSIQNVALAISDLGGQTYTAASMLVSGVQDGGASAFTDLLLIHRASATINVVSSLGINQGSAPPTRTYSKSAGADAVFLACSANTHSIRNFSQRVYV